ncbi:MAG: hypothetical protein IAG13_30635 [Deltaproteobacteria bacterium]|nr:hypothetical protein [Nannocystaceae bacterium]
MPGQVTVREQKVVVVVSGFHSEVDAKRCANEVNDLLDRKTGLELVVDLTAIDGFSREAREVWQGYFRSYAKAVHTLTIVGGTALARMASAAVCLYAGIKMKTANHLSEVFPNDA